MKLKYFITPYRILILICEIKIIIPVCLIFTIFFLKIREYKLVRSNDNLSCKLYRCKAICVCRDSLIYKSIQNNLNYNLICNLSQPFFYYSLYILAILYFTLMSLSFCDLFLVAGNSCKAETKQGEIETKLSFSSLYVALFGSFCTGQV